MDERLGGLTLTMPRLRNLHKFKNKVLDTSLFGKLKPAQVYSLKINKPMVFYMLWEGRRERGLRSPNRKLTLLFFPNLIPNYYGVKPTDLRSGLIHTAGLLFKKNLGKAI